jgi:hypothetical protein
VVRGFLKAYGDPGFFVLVGLVLVGGLLLVVRGGRGRPALPPDPVCERCGGTGRFISQDGKDWPCLEEH